MQRRALFGGAIDVSLPSTFRDVSTLRQVPDHQEAFVSDDATDLSFVFEIVERQSGVSDDEAGRYFWRDLAHSNAARRHRLADEKTVDAVTLPMTSDVSNAFVTVVVGEQEIAKSPIAAEIDRVQVYLAVVRLPSVASELLLSLNAPQRLAGMPSDPATPLFHSVLESVVIKDWSLFVLGFKKTPPSAN